MGEREQGREALHLSVARDLREQIAAGRWGRGEALPSEAALRARYGVSRSTIRQALARLAAAGLVQSVAGRGTFVAPARTEGGRPSLGFVVPRLAGMFMAQILEGMHEAAARAQIGLTIQPTNCAPGAEEAALRRLRAAGVAGAAVLPSVECGTSPEVFRELAGAGFVVVFLDCWYPGVPMPRVTSDNFAGGRALARHLLRLGHRRLGYIQSRDLRATSVQDRLRGLYAALEEVGLDRRAVRVVAVSGGPGDPWDESAREAADRLLSGERVTAILCANDDIAIHVLGAIREHGLRVPEDVAVVGFDDLPFAALVDPPLTTVRQRAKEMGSRVVTLLLERLEHGSAGADQVVLPVELCMRVSGGEQLPLAAAPERRETPGTAGASG